METGNSTSTTSRVKFDSSYALSIGGILKIIQIILNIIGLILIQSSGIYAQVSRAEFYSFVSGTALCVTTILLLLHLFHITEVISSVPWFLVELVYCLLWTLFYLIAGFLTVGLVNGNFNVAGYFAFVATVAYALEACYGIYKIRVTRT